MEWEIEAASIAMGMKTNRPWIALACMAADVSCGMAQVGEIIKVPMKEEKMTALRKCPDDFQENPDTRKIYGEKLLESTRNNVLRIDSCELI